MNTDNYPSYESPAEAPKNNDSRNWIIGLLAVGLVVSVGYGVMHSSTQTQIQEKQETQIAAVTDNKGKLQSQFDDALVRLDSMKGYNTKVQSMLAKRQTDIAQAKTQIRKLLSKERLTESQKKEAETLIAQLNDKISGMEQDVARLTEANQGLTKDNVQLTSDKESLTSSLQTTTTQKDSLAKEVDIASTLNATNIMISSLEEKKNGHEKMTNKAKKANELKLSFDVTNRITQNGQTDVYICITDPSGKMIVDSSKGSGSFTAAEQGDKSFTGKVPVEFESGKVVPVKFTWKQDNGFQKGDYKIEIYQNGYKIGEGVKELKKGGLFS